MAAAVLLAAVVTGVAAVAVFSGDGDGSDAGGAGRDTTTTTAEPSTSTSTATTSTTTGPGATDDADPLPPSTAIGAGDDPNPTVPDTTPEDAADVDLLRDLLLDAAAVRTAVPGVEQVGEQVLDLEAAAELELDASAERSLLQTRGFEAGVSRSFEADGGVAAYLHVYEFASRTGAEAYLRDGVINAEAAGARPFEVTTIDGAQGFTAADDAGGGTFTGHVVAFVRGARHYLVVAGGIDGGPGPEDASRLAGAQLAAVIEAE